MTKGTPWRLALLGLVVLTGVGPIVPQAEAASSGGGGELRNIVIILDSSGSMAARLGGESKLDAAQRVVRELVGNMPSDMNVGLLVYGAGSPRERRDCSDIQVLQPVGPVDSAAVASALSRAHPRGMTPIGASLRQAADQLKGRPGASTIVLVSDGGETCGANPCEIAQEIRTGLGIDVRIHVVGFDVESSDRSRLECVAQGGGGNYYPAATSDELEHALIDATRPQRPRGGSRAMWLSIAHPGLGEMANSGRGWAGVPQRKFWLGLIPGFGWPGYLQVVSAIDAAHGRTNDWLEPPDR